MSTNTTIQIRTTGEFKEKLQALSDSRYMTMSAVMMMALHKTFPELSPTSFDNRSAKEIMADMKPEDIPEVWRLPETKQPINDEPTASEPRGHKQAKLGTKNSFSELQKKKTK